MSSKLKPLILPQLVEERRKLDDGHEIAALVTGIDGTSVFLVDNASFSDTTSPATPTFSHRSGLGHLRYSSSTSSLDLPLPIPSPTSLSECPASPTNGTISSNVGATSVPLAHPIAHTNTGSSAPKRQLPDVQEEDTLERDGEDVLEDYEDLTAMHRNSELYGCLCDEPCTHGREYRSAGPSSEFQSFDYELGSASDSDQITANPRFTQGRQHRAGGSVSGASIASAQDSSFSGLTLRFGSRIHALSRWRSGSLNSRRTFVNLTGAPASEPSLSRAPSSRSSSLSAAVVSDPPMPMTSSALSFYGSTENIAHIPASACSPTTTETVVDALDIEEDGARRSLERDRAMATTPLLPPLFINIPQPPGTSTMPPSLQASPLQSPTVASPAMSSSAAAEGMTASATIAADSSIPAFSLSPSAFPPSPADPVPAMEVLPSPLLSKKFSVSSFLHQRSSGAPKPVSAAASPPTLEPYDSWSDRLGHANYTITPKPPCNLDAAAGEATTDGLRRLRADWGQARVNYAKHLVRVGEHYGTTSNTYVLTEAKWAETERSWRAAHDALLARLEQKQKGENDEKAYDRLSVFPLHPQHDLSSMVPQILDAEGKFPHRGDEDIVGPMDRAACMAPNTILGGSDGEDERRKVVAKIWRSLAGRVRLRK